jgi:hypothetical protein
MYIRQILKGGRSGLIRGGDSKWSSTLNEYRDSIKSEFGELVAGLSAQGYQSAKIYVGEWWFDPQWVTRGFECSVAELSQAPTKILELVEEQKLNPISARWMPLHVNIPDAPWAYWETAILNGRWWHGPRFACDEKWGVLEPWDPHATRYFEDVNDAHSVNRWVLEDEERSENYLLAVATLHAYGKLCIGHRPKWK